MANNSTAKGSTNTAVIVAMAFVILKLCHVINWSWWWVLSPVWIPAGIAIILLVLLWLIGRSSRR